MSKPSKNELLAMLWNAYGAPIGLLVWSSDPERARARLYAARKAAQSEELDCLQIRLTKDFGDEGQILIVKGEKK